MFLAQIHRVVSGAAIHIRPPPVRRYPPQDVDPGSTISWMLSNLSHRRRVSAITIFTDTVSDNTLWRAAAQV